MSNVGFPWRAIEEAELLDRLKQGMTITQCAIAHGRTTGAIQSRQKVIARAMHDAGKTIEEITDTTRLNRDVVRMVIDAYSGRPVEKPNAQQVFGFAPPPPDTQVSLLREIRDLLKETSGQKETIEDLRSQIKFLETLVHTMITQSTQMK